MADNSHGSGDDPALPGKAAATDLAGLGEISRTILTSVADAIGVLYRPRAIRDQGQAQADADAYATIRRAEAEAQARLIADGAQEELERRALTRLRAREVRKQITLERTLDAAVDVAESAGSQRSRPLETDWTTAFIDHAQEISAEQLRAIWARVLARQADADAPAVSRATLDSIRLWAAMGQVMDLDDGPDGAININEMEMLALTEIGLLRRESGREANLEFTNCVLSFHAPLQGQTNPSWQPREIRIDRLLPTWRGMELATVLFPGLYAAMSDPDGPGAVAPGYADQETRAALLTDWAESFAGRGVAVVLNGLQPRTDLPDGGGTILRPQMVLSGSDPAWQDLSTSQADLITRARQG